MTAETTRPAQPVPATEREKTLDPDGQFARGMLTDLARMGASAAGLSLAAQLFGVGPCEGCGYRKLHCRCIDPHPFPSKATQAEPTPLEPPRYSYGPDGKGPVTLLNPVSPREWAERAQPQAPASAVKVERGRVWIVAGNQSFMLAHEGDAEELNWYAGQLRTALSSITPCVKADSEGAAPASAGTLTDSAIIGIMAAVGLRSGNITDFITFARAIEAHIKGSPKP
jgi:hypothetical protein